MCASESDYLFWQWRLCAFACVGRSRRLPRGGRKWHPPSRVKERCVCGVVHCDTGCCCCCSAGELFRPLLCSACLLACWRLACLHPRPAIGREREKDSKRKSEREPCGELTLLVVPSIASRRQFACCSCERRALCYYCCCCQLCAKAFSS